MSFLDMLGRVLRSASGPLEDLINKLSGIEAKYWLWALKKFLRKENPWRPLIYQVDEEASSGEGFVATLEKIRSGGARTHKIDNVARSILTSKHFRPCSRLRTHVVVFVSASARKSHEYFMGEGEVHGYRNLSLAQAAHFHQQIVSEDGIYRSLIEMGVGNLIYMHTPVQTEMTEGFEVLRYDLNVKLLETWQHWGPEWKGGVVGYVFDTNDD